MTATMQSVREPKNAPETIIENTPKTPFISPLQQYIENFCKVCNFYQSKCRIEDSRGLTPMSLCIRLYTTQGVDQTAKEYIEGLMQFAKKPILQSQDEEVG